MLLERPKPIAEQVNEILRQRIRSRQYRPGHRLPSESELASELGVSRATLRTALARLAAEGLIIRRQGDGTYVNERLEEVNTSLGGMLDFWRLIESGGYQPTIHTISITQRMAIEQEAEALAITADAPVLSLIRLFLADDRPFILAMNVIPLHFFAGDTDLFDGRLPLHKFLRRYASKEINYAIYDIRPMLANEKAVEFLKCGPESPLLLLTTTFYDNSNAPLVFGKSYYDAAVMGLRFVQTWS